MMSIPAAEAPGSGDSIPVKERYPAPPRTMPNVAPEGGRSTMSGSSTFGCNSALSWVYTMRESEEKFCTRHNRLIFV